MSEAMPGYDAYKLAYPPHYDRDDPLCRHCSYPEDDHGIAENCVCVDFEPDDSGDEGPDPDDAMEARRERDW